jgi:hypothetical protein
VQVLSAKQLGPAVVEAVKQHNKMHPQQPILLFTIDLWPDKDAIFTKLAQVQTQDSGPATVMPVEKLLLTKKFFPSTIL